MDQKFKSCLIKLFVSGLFFEAVAGFLPCAQPASGATRSDTTPFQNAIGQSTKLARKKTTKRSTKPASKSSVKPTPAVRGVPTKQIEQAIAEFQRGDVEKARTLLETALSSALTGDTAAVHSERARALLWLAHYNVLIGQGEAAAREFRKALSETNDVNTQAMLCQKAIYDLNWDVFQPGLALQAAELGAECAEHIGNPRLLGQMRERQGAFLWAIGARAGAIEIWESLLSKQNAADATKEESQNNSLAGKMNPVEGFWLNYRLILAYASTGSEDSASAKVPHMKQAAKESGDPRLAIYADFCDGYRYLLSGLASQAPAKFQSAWKLLEARREPETELRVVLPAFWSIACRKKDDLTGAANALRLAQSGLSRLSPNHSARDLITLAAADLSAAQGRPDETLQLLRERLSAVDKFAVANWPSVNNMECDGMLQQVYHAYVARLCAAGQIDEAFTWAEKARITKLRGLLESGNVLPQRGMSEVQRVEEARRVGQVRLASWRARGEAQTTGDFLIVGAVENLRRLRVALQTQNPDLAGLRGWTPALDITGWLPENTALLVYEFCDAMPEGLSQDVSDATPTLFVATVNQGRSQVHHYELKASVGKSRDATLDLEKTVKEFFTFCTDPKSDFKTDAGESASKLYETLLKPALADLESKQSLLLCPDGVLWEVPFAALQNGGTFVLDKWQIAYAPSLSLAAQSLRSAAAKQANNSASLLVVADPTFGGADRFSSEGQAETTGGRRVPITADGRAISIMGRGFTTDGFGPRTASRAIVADARGLLAEGRGLFAEGRGAEDTPSGRRWPGRGAFRKDNSLWPLPGTRLEADAIQKTWPRSTLWSGAQAQESAFKARMGEFAYCHLASHAICSDGAPLLSWIAFAKPVASSGASVEDGLLTASEIFKLDWPARNVTLSAAALFGMRHSTGSGALLFLAALQSAGTRTQTLTRWPSDEVATSTFAQVYYSALQENQSPSTALRRAALEVRKNQSTSHPYYWANWMVAGDWR